MYIIDTNAVVDFYDRYYCPDVFETLSRDVNAIAAQNKVFLISQVIEELDRNLNTDSLSELKKLQLNRLPESQSVQKNVAEITQHLEKSNRAKLVTNFLRGADIYLIAQAIVHRKKIISNERGLYNTNSKIFIPAVARHYKIETLELVDFFRHEGLCY